MHGSDRKARVAERGPMGRKDICMRRRLKHKKKDVLKNIMRSTVSTGTNHRSYYFPHDRHLGKDYTYQ